MPSYLSAEDVRRALDRALESPRGITVTRTTPSLALSFVARANTLRRKDKAENFETYPEGHSLKHASAWDVLRINAVDCVVYITKGDADTIDLYIEEI